MVLGKLPVPGGPTNLDKSGARVYCAYSRCRWGLFGVGGGCLDIFYHFSLLSPGSVWTEILSQRAVKPKTTNIL